MKKSALLGAVGLSILLAGCASASPGIQAESLSPEASASSSSSSSSSPATAASATPSKTSFSHLETPAAAAEPERSTRGNIIKKPGEVAGTMNDAQEDVVTFTVHSVKADFKCDAESRQKPENGHFLALEVSAETKSVEEHYSGNWQMNLNDFKTINPDGTTSNANLSTGPAYTCVKSSEMLPEMGDNEKARGLVILDVETAKGTLIYEDSYAQAGWEWEFPAK